jgi:beta-fructofuranosidase
MVLGSQDIDGLGRALIYSSKDLLHWELATELSKAKTKETEGYMWECPDFFHLDGKDILLMSPQGLEADGDRFRNLNQTGYLLGNVEDNKLQHDGFVEIDNGHDFYATQTMLTPDGRRVMIAWMNAWDSPMPEIEDGWAGALTVPRELSVKDGYILQKPVRELMGLRQDVLLDGSLEPQRDYALGRLAELELTFTQQVSGLLLLLTDGEKSLQLSLEPNGRFVLNRNTENGERAAVLRSQAPLKVQIFIDRSSAEVFVADGELTFTERIYWEKDVNCRLLAQAANQAKAWRLENETNQY